MPGYFSYIAKLDDPGFFWPGFFWNDLPEEGELRSEPWQGASKASRGPQQAVLAGVEEGEARRTAGKRAEATSEALDLFPVVCLARALQSKMTSFERATHPM